MKISNITGLDLAHIEQTAKRVIDVDFYGARDAEATPETVTSDIINEPLTVINFLLDMIDDLQA